MRVFLHTSLTYFHPSSKKLRKDKPNNFIHIKVTNIVPKRTSKYTQPCKNTEIMQKVIYKRRILRTHQTEDNCNVGLQSFLYPRHNTRKYCSSLPPTTDCHTEATNFVTSSRHHKSAHNAALNKLRFTSGTGFPFLRFKSYSAVSCLRGHKGAPSCCPLYMMFPTL